MAGPRSTLNQQAIDNARINDDKQALNKEALNRLAQLQKDIEIEKKYRDSLKDVAPAAGEWVLQYGAQKTEEEKEQDDEIATMTIRRKDLLPDGIYKFENKNNSKDTRPFKIEVKDGKISIFPPDAGTPRDRARAKVQLFAKQMGKGSHGVTITYDGFLAEHVDSDLRQIRFNKFKDDVKIMMEECLAAGVPFYLDDVNVEALMKRLPLNEYEEWKKLETLSQKNKDFRYTVAERVQHMEAIQKELTDKYQFEKDNAGSKDAKKDEFKNKINFNQLNGEIDKLNNLPSTATAAQKNEIQTNLDSGINTLKNQIKDEIKTVGEGMAFAEATLAKLDKYKGLDEENFDTATNVAIRTQEPGKKTAIKISETLQDLHEKIVILESHVDNLLGKEGVRNTTFGGERLPEIAGLKGKLEELKAQYNEMSTKATQVHQEYTVLTDTIAAAAPFKNKENNTVAKALAAKNLQTSTITFANRSSL